MLFRSLSRRYLRKDKTGAIVETPEQMMKRVATVAANRGGSNLKSHDELVPNWLVVAQEMPNALEYFEMLRDFRFLPNSPALANAGTRTGQLSACFVLPVEDDLASIFDTVRDAALIHQTGGGTGFAFSRLRAKGAIVASTLGVSSGPVAFMDVFNAATEVIKQGGMRRGANMGILRVDHPDILRFVAHKSDLTKLTSFNVSVAVTNAFMEAVEQAMSEPDLVPRVHLEHFHPRTIAEGMNHEFTVYAAASGVEFVVPVDESVLMAADFEGVVVPGDCLEGTCGSCETRVLVGEIDHRDSILTPLQRRDSQTMMICVSRARPGCSRIELDL